MPISDTDRPGAPTIEALGAHGPPTARAEIGRVIFGQESGGRGGARHPAVGRARAAGRRTGPGQDAAGRNAGHRARPCIPKRVQFTPDLMPADITGSEVLDDDGQGRRSFRFVPGPVFCQLLMADEINRASPRTQSALLQAMQEGRVAVGGVDHPLPRSPSTCWPRRNPLEQEGTYPLPEAQLDRFLLQVDVDYPDLDAERTMLLATTGADRWRSARPVLTGDELMAAQRLIRRVPVGEGVVEAILEPRARRPAGDDGRRCRAPPCRLGPRPAGGAGAHAGLPGARGAGRAAVPQPRRRRCVGAAGAAAPHGAQFLCTGRGGRPTRRDRRLGRPGHITA